MHKFTPYNLELISTRDTIWSEKKDIWAQFPYTNQSLNMTSPTPSDENKVISDETK